MSSDLVKEIPARAFINALIINQTLGTEQFSDCTRSVLASAGFPRTLEYQFKNPAFIVSLLYCFLVVPKAIWLAEADDPVYAQIERDKLVDLIRVREHHNCRTAGSQAVDLIRHLRNAAAHARYAIDESQNFIFWDQAREDSPVYWRASASNSELMAFLNGVGKVMMFLRDTRPG